MIDKKVSTPGLILLVLSALQIFPMYLYALILAQPHSDGLEREFSPLNVATMTAAVDMIIQVLGFYVVAAWFYRILPWQHKIISLLMASMVVFFMMAVGGHPEFIGARIANITKFGNFYATELTLSEEGCKTANSISNHVCFGTKDTGFKLCGASVVSRIGSETYLKLYEDDAEPEQAKEPDVHRDRFTRSVFLPSKEILGLTLYDIKGIAMPSDKRLIGEIAMCRIRNRQPGKTVLPPGGDSFFRFDKDELQDAGKKMLAELAEKLVALKSEPWSVTVHGYTDQIGQQPDNLALSKRRAEAVATHLKTLLPVTLHERISTPSGAGSTRLRKTDVDCPKQKGKQQRVDCLADNRRAELTIVSSGSAR